MKTLLLILTILGFIAIVLLPLAGCETITNEDGSVTKRVDTKAIRESIEAGEGAYRFYRDQQRPMYDQPAYQQRLLHQGQMFYPDIRTYPQVITTYP